MRTSAAQVLALARADIGLTESPANSNNIKFTRWYGAVGAPYCAMAISYWTWTAAHANGEKSPLEGIQSPLGNAYCPYFISAAKRGYNGLAWHDDVHADSIGAVAQLVLFDFEKTGVAGHVGIIERMVDRHSFYTIEANTSSGNSGSQSNGGGVYRRLRRDDAGYVLGYVSVPFGAGAAPTPAPKPTIPAGAPAWPGRALHLTTPLMHGNDVSLFQGRMHQRGWDIDVDGFWGEQSDLVTRQFQHQKGLLIDGVVGPATWTAVFRTDNVT
jgi:hypothetical protein